MNSNPLKQGALTEHSNGIGAVTLGMVANRALELARINGRSLHGNSRADWEQARRELAGDFAMDPNDLILESALESERWNPVAGSFGHKVQIPSGDDVDDEGRSDMERLFAEGLAGAEHDQMLQASRQAESNNQ